MASQVPSKKRNLSTTTPPSSPPPFKRRKLDVPSKIEESPNSSAKCQRCEQIIRKGEIRQGCDYDMGYRWWHKGCFNVYEDEYSLDTTGRATCRKCKNKIPKGSVRLGIEIWEPFHYRYRYYHPTCLTNAEIEELGEIANSELLNKKDHQPSPLKLTISSAVAKREVGNEDDRLLRQTLERLRSTFASRLSCDQAFKIYSNDVIDKVVTNKPKTEKELLEIRGIGEKKLQSFGSSILTVVKQNDIKRKQKQKAKQNCNKRVPAWARPKQKHTDDNDSIDFQVVASLSCEEIVNLKFEEAKKNGYVIEI